MTRKVHTPKGIFRSLSAAGVAYGLPAGSIQWKIKTNPKDYYYINDDAPIISEEIDMSDIKEFTLNGIRYKVDDLYSKVNGHLNYQFKNGKFIAKYPNVTLYKDHLRVAMMSLDELQELYPEKPRELIAAQRRVARDKVKNDPLFIEWRKQKQLSKTK